MKKFIILVAFLLLGANITQASESIDITNLQNLQEIQNRIDKIGFRILNSNGIEKRTVFDYSIKMEKNAYSKYSNRQIVLYKGLYLRLNSDDEVAAILSHEISHSVDSYDGILRGFFSYINDSKKSEYKADKRAIDYMVRAGYNPVALIVVFSKALPEERYDWYSTHPLTSRRMMAVYEYIYNKYPQYLVNNVYKDDLYYQNFLLTSKAKRAEFQEKIRK